MADSEPSIAPLVDFFRGEGSDYGRKGDYEGWTAEETAVHFLREHIACGAPPPEVDWNKVLTHIGSELRITLARHPKVGNALTLGEADQLITDLSSKLTYDTHKIVDPSYDS
jgi:hypothetical protein